MAALTKPLFPLAASAETVFVARFLDRIGKGIRGAPRDALVADVAPPAIRGACFGLRQSMDTVGSFLGPSLAIVIGLVAPALAQRAANPRHVISAAPARNLQAAAVALPADTLATLNAIAAKSERKPTNEHGPTN
jgi:MFS family permease